MMPSRTTSSTIRRWIAFVGVALQLPGFMLLIGPELTWRPVAMAAELSLCWAMVVVAFRTQRRWPVVMLAVWQALLAAAIWIANLQWGCIDYTDQPGRCGLLGGPEPPGVAATVWMGAGSLLLLAAAWAGRRRGRPDVG